MHATTMIANALNNQTTIVQGLSAHSFGSGLEKGNETIV